MSEQKRESGDYYFGDNTVCELARRRVCDGDGTVDVDRGDSLW